MNQHQFADAIAILRKQKGLTQKELANQLNVTDKAVSKWERGAGYPEITILPSLAKALGVSIDQLFGEEPPYAQEEASFPGGQDKPPAPPEQAKASRQHKGRRRKLSRPFSYLTTMQGWEAVLSLLLLVAMLVCLVVDIAVNQQVSWSIYVMGSCALFWCLVTPLLLLGRSRVLVSLAALTILIFPYLMLVEFLSPNPGWLIPIGGPACIVGLLLLWAVALLKCVAKISWWLISALIVFVSPGIDFYLNSRIAVYLHQVGSLEMEQPLPWTINVLACTMIGLVLLCIWLIQRKKKQARLS